MGRYTVHRTDTGSKALIKYAESLGFIYCPIEGAIDGVLQWGNWQCAVDWKSKGGTLTPNQQRLIAKGFRILFIQQAAQLKALKADLKRAA